MKKLVIVGSGMSAMKVVDEVLKIDPLMYKITIIGKEYFKYIINSIVWDELSDVEATAKRGELIFIDFNESGQLDIKNINTDEYNGLKEKNSDRYQRIFEDIEMSKKIISEKEEESKERAKDSTKTI